MIVQHNMDAPDPDPDQGPQKNWITIKIEIWIHGNMMWIRNTGFYFMIVQYYMDDSDTDQDPQKTGSQSWSRFGSMII